MAKKMPKKTQTAVQTETSPVALKEDKAVAVEKKNHKAAVKVDSKSADPKKNKKPNKANANKKPNVFKRMLKGMKGIVSELKKVTWPKGKDVAKATSVVLAVVFAFFVILFGIDYVLAGLLNLIVEGEWATIFI